MNELQNLREAYANRRVLVTGHTGFKGAWLAFWLRHLGAVVMGAALDPPSVPSLYGVLRLDELVSGVRLDVTDYPRLAAILGEFRPEAVFHLAARALVRASYQSPLETLRTNVMGTAHVLEACRHVPSVRAAVIVTSDKCYRNNEWIWGYRENDPMGGHDPYSASKGCAELVTASYIKSFFPAEEYGKTHRVAVASGRAGNAVGGGDWGEERLVPDCFRALSEGRAIRLRYPHAVRPWQHVLESLSGYLLLGARMLEHGPRFGCGWNFSPPDKGDVWSVERVVKRLCLLWGGGACEISGDARPHEAHWLCLDCTKASVELGWRPRYRTARALEETIRWYRAWLENPDPEHMRTVTLRQIQEYADAAPDGRE